MIDSSHWTINYWSFMFLNTFPKYFTISRTDLYAFVPSCGYLRSGIFVVYSNFSRALFWFQLIELCGNTYFRFASNCYLEMKMFDSPTFFQAVGFKSYRIWKQFRIIQNLAVSYAIKVMSIMLIIKYILRFWHGEFWNDIKWALDKKHPIEPAKIVFFSREKICDEGKI